MVDLATFKRGVGLWALPYAETVHGLCAEVSAQSGIEIDPWIVYGIGQQESLWGKALTPQGAGGTGDFAIRTWPQDRINRMPVTVIGPVIDPKTGKQIVSAAGIPFFRVMPPDGGGWGRGLLQIDYQAHFGWVTQNAWKDPETNVARGIAVLLDAFKYLRSKIPGPPSEIMKYALAAYNCGAGRVLVNIRNGRGADYSTATGDYSARVMRFALRGQALSQGVA